MKHLYLIFLLLIFSCSLDNNSSEISQLSDDNTVAKINDIDNLVNSTTIEYDDDWDYYSTNVKTRLSKVETLNNLFSNQQNDIEILMAVVYVSNNKTDGIAINYFNTYDKNYYLDIYSNQEASNKLIRKYSFISNDVVMLDLMRLKYYLFDESDIDMIIADNFEYKDSNTNRSDLSSFLRNKTWDKLSLFNNTSNSAKSANAAEGAYACGYIGPCRTQNGKCCKPGIFYCSNDCGCGKDELQVAFSQKLNLSTNDIESVLISDKYYAFRDDFLANSTLGLKYVEIFYSSTGQFKDVFDVDLLWDFYNVFPDINNSIDKLLDQNFNGIIISESLRLDIIKIVDKMILKTKSQVFKDLLSDFKYDFNSVSNKTRTEINSIIDNN